MATPGHPGHHGRHIDMADAKGLGLCRSRHSPSWATDSPFPRPKALPTVTFPLDQSLPLQYPVVTAKKRQARALGIPGKRGTCHPGPEQPGSLTSVGQTNIIK